MLQVPRNKEEEDAATQTHLDRRCSRALNAESESPAHQITRRISAHGSICRTKANSTRILWRNGIPWRRRGKVREAVDLRTSCNGRRSRKTGTSWWRGNKTTRVHPLREGEALHSCSVLALSNIDDVCSLRKRDRVLEDFCRDGWKEPTWYLKQRIVMHPCGKKDSDQ